MINKNIIGKPLIVESFEGNEKLNTTVEYFKNWGNNIISSEIIKFSKGSHSLETAIKTNLIDLTNGNILEKEVESGIKTSYIWGYNKNLIVAKIENISYNSIPSNLITAIENESNNGTETSLLNALNDLRNNSALSGTMITTYTHIPSVGISTLTDPKGNFVSYFYDAFNRIKYVKDKDNKIVNEKKYHYKIQN